MKIFLSVIMIRDIGGIAPSTLNLLNEIKNDHEITLCVLAYKSPNKEIPSGINVIPESEWIRDCCAPREFLYNQNSFQKIIRTYRRTIKRLFGLDYILSKATREMQKRVTDEYDVAIAFANDIFSNGKHVFGADNTIVEKAIKAKKKIAWIHNDLSKTGYNPNICERVYRNFDSVVCVSKDNQRILNNMYVSGASKTTTVYNMFNIDLIKSMALSEDNPFYDSSKIHFITVARIDDQKRIDRIVKVCRKLKMEGYANFDWTVIGDGVNKKNIERDIKKYNIENIYMLGTKKNPYPYMLHADASVLSSAYEGYSMTVIESQILCTPTIVTNYESAYEAVVSGKNGYICDNSTEGLYNMIKIIVNDPKLLEPCKKYLKCHPFSNSVALQQFNSIISF